MMDGTAEAENSKVYERPSDGAKTWDRPWSIGEMRASAGNWSLAGDAGMLHHLQQFSQQLLAQTHAMEDKLSQLNHQAKLTNVRLDNVFNDFIMLANKQFVENRVYDEDVSQPVKPPDEQKEKKDKTPEQRESELIPRIKEALSLGMSVIDTAFEKLDINEANSSDEEEEGEYGSHQQTDIILEPKDPYIHRQLPHLIGSAAFMQDDNVGLSELPSEDEEEPKESESESETETESESGSEMEDKKPAHAAVKQRVPGQWSETESESGSDLFEGSEESSEETPDQRNERDNRSDSGTEQDISQTPKTEASFRNELADKIGAPSVGGGQKKKPETKKKKPPPDDLFGGFGEASDEDSPFAQSGGRFQSKGLFDEEEEEEGGDMFAVAPKGTKQSTPEEPKVKDDARPTKPKTKQSARGLFDADDEDDLFATTISAPPPKKSQPAKKTAHIFGDESEEEESQPIKSQKTPTPSQPKKKVPAGGVSMFGAGGSEVLRAAMRQKSESESEKDDWDSRSSSQEKPVSIQSSISSDRVPPPMPPSDDEDDDDDDLFSSKPVRKSNKKPIPSGAVKIMPDVSKEKPKSRAAPSKTAPSGGGLFDDDDDDLFGGSSFSGSSRGDSREQSVEKQKPPTQKAESQKPQSQSRPPPSFGGGLFEGEEDEDDLFAAIKPKASPAKNVKPAASTLLFANEDEDLFSSLGPAKKTTKPAAEEKKMPTVKKKKVPTATLR